MRSYGKIHRKLPIFRVKSVKIYTGQKKFTRTCPWRPWQIWGMVKASSAKIVAHRGSKFEVDRCHQLSSPVISCQYFHHLLLERPEIWWWCHQLLKGTGWWVTMMYKNTGCFFNVPKKTTEKKSLSIRIFSELFPLL